MTIVIGAFGVALVVLVGWLEYRSSPACNWCQSRHRGRCIYNPRAGRLWSNANDGHFDVNDPNK